jgi:superfamily I DNA and RNA helicase
MLESSEHWSDIGYVVREGEFKAGSPTKIERPKENSLSIISDQGQFDDLVRATRYESVEEEVQSVADQVAADIEDGLRPEDILVVAVDDRNAKTYLTKAEFALAQRKVQCNNLHGDSFGIRDFTKDGRVTLSTVHKAKGNEAFMVYVIGCDAIMADPNVRRRNMLFTAMTRAKGWVRVSGVGDRENLLIKEITAAKENFPCLVFSYPGPAQLKIMKRDLAEAADRKLRAQRLIDQLQTEFTDDEIAELLRKQKTRRSSKGKRKQ